MLAPLAIDLADLAGGALSGALVTSVLGPIVAQRRERRDTRADVLRAISTLETTRWAPREWDDFRKGVSTLWAAALVANAPRALVAEYIQLAYVARRASERSWEELPDEEHSGGIPGDLASLTRDAAATVIDHIWHPHHRRLLTRRDLKRLATKTKVVKQKLREDGQPVDWTEWRHF